MDGPGVGAVGPREVILSSGERVPYPEPSSAAATKIGVANRRRDTAAEPRLRSELHARGLRFRKDLLIRAGRVRVHPDIVFTRAKVAVFLDGCFWHACPEHGTVPKSNVTYWTPKLTANTERDLRVNEALTTDGWMDGPEGLGAREPHTRGGRARTDRPRTLGSAESSTRRARRCAMMVDVFSRSLHSLSTTCGGALDLRRSSSVSHPLRNVLGHEGIATRHTTNRVAVAPVRGGHG